MDKEEANFFNTTKHRNNRSVGLGPMMSKAQICSEKDVSIRASLLKLSVENSNSFDDVIISKFSFYYTHKSLVMCIILFTYHKWNLNN